MDARSVFERGHQQEKGFRKVLGSVTLALALNGSHALTEAMAATAASMPRTSPSSVEKGAVLADTAAQKPDTRPPENTPLLADANVGRSEPPAALDHSVESLLTRMAQAKGSSPAPDASATGASAQPPATGMTESKSVDSLLARMAAVSGPGRIETPEIKPVLAPEPTSPPPRADTAPAAVVAEPAVVPVSKGGELSLAADPAPALSNAPSIATTTRPAPSAQAAPATAPTNAPPLEMKARPAHSIPPAPASPPSSAPAASRWAQWKSYIPWGKSNAESAAVPPAAAPKPIDEAPAALTAAKPSENLTPIQADAKPAAAPSPTNATLASRLVSKVTSATSLLSHLRSSGADTDPKSTAGSASSESSTGDAGTPAAGDANPAPTVNPALANRLRLTAVASFGQRRGASINDRTVFQGQEAEFNVDGVRLKVRCLEVKDSSAVVQLAGATAPTELWMRRTGE